MCRVASHHLRFWSTVNTVCTCSGLKTKWGWADVGGALFKWNILTFVHNRMFLNDPIRVRYAYESKSIRVEASALICARACRIIGWWPLAHVAHPEWICNAVNGQLLDRQWKSSYIWRKLFCRGMALCYAAVCIKNVPCAFNVGRFCGVAAGCVDGRNTDRVI